MIEAVDSSYLALKRLCRKPLCLIPIVKVLMGYVSKLWYFRHKLFPHILVIAHIHIERRFSCLDCRKKLLYYRRKYLLLCACSTDGEQKAHRLSALLSGSSGSTVCLNIGHKLMVNIMSGIHKAVGRHWL